MGFIDSDWYSYEEADNYKFEAMISKKVDSLEKRVANLESEVEVLKMINAKLIARLDACLDLGDFADYFSKMVEENIVSTSHPSAVFLTTRLDEDKWVCSLLTSDYSLSKSSGEAYKERKGSKYRYELLSLTSKEAANSPEYAVIKLEELIKKELNKIESKNKLSALLKARAKLYREILNF